MPSADEARQLATYRSQIEEYEARLRLSFEEKERETAALLESLTQQQQQLARQHTERRQLCAKEGR